MKILDRIRNHPRYIKWRYPPGTVVYVTVRDRRKTVCSTYATIDSQMIFAAATAEIGRIYQTKDVLSIRKVKKKEEFTARLKGLLVDWER